MNGYHVQIILKHAQDVKDMNGKRKENGKGKIKNDLFYTRRK